MWYASTGPVDCPTADYEEQTSFSDLYLVPLNSNIDVTPITVNGISVGVEAPEC